MLDILKAIINYDHTFTILFYMTIAVLVFINWHRFEIQGGFMALLKTKIGLKLMDSWGHRYREFIRLLGIIGIGVGYVGMIVSFFLIAIMFYEWVIKPYQIDGSPVVLPGVALAGTGGIIFPLVIGWISILIIMIVHEFSHGVVARAYDIPVKSSGLAFIGPILGAFVEPDEKKVEESGDIAAYSVFAAGPFSNIILTILFIPLLIGLPFLGGLMTEEAGVKLSVTEGMPTALAGVPDEVIIQKVNEKSVQNTTGFQDTIIDVKPNQTITFTSPEKTYTIITGTHPANESKGYFGITIRDYRETKIKGIFMTIIYWLLRKLYEIAFWVAILSLNVGIINLFPIFITDGARMLKVSMENIYTDKEKATRIWILINKICIATMLAIIFIPLIRKIITPIIS
jgi:membrane-associated protease RseP (regulator of RpoE activity)